MKDDLFFIASKTLGMAARAESWLILLAVLALLAAWRGRLRAVRLWAGLCALALAGLTVLPLGDPLLARLEGQYPPRPAVTGPVDGIIVLGGAEDVAPLRRWGQPALNAGGERAIAAAELARRFPEARLIYTGGMAALGGDAQPGDPSRIMTDIWRSLGLPDDRIVTEALSRNTSENARFTRDLIRPQPGQRWLLVTSAFHMPRAMETFARAGWTGLVAWPVDYRSGSMVQGAGWQLDSHLSNLDLALKEYLGLVAYRLAGE